MYTPEDNSEKNWSASPESKNTIDTRIILTHQNYRIRHPGFPTQGKISFVVISIITCLLVWKYWISNDDGVGKSILDSVPLTDGHNDFPIWLRVFHGNHIDFNETMKIDGMVDFPRLHQGHSGAQFWSVYVPCPASYDDHSSSVYYEIVHDTFQQIDLVHRLIERFKHKLYHAHSAQDIWSGFQKDPASIASLMGVEGLHQIGNSASILRTYHLLGVRYVTLTHDCNNKYADAALSPRPTHNGLSGAGKELMREMNRLGMLIDLSHTSDATMRDALNVTLAPVIFSHSNARALCPHPRNVPDDILFHLRDNGGVIMVSFYAEYLGCRDPSTASLEDVVNHLIYIGKLIGFEHVGIGSDFDGMSRGPHGLEDVSKYPNLISALVAANLSRIDIEGIAGRNVLRVLTEAEEVARGMSRVLPLEDTVKPMPQLAFA